MTMIMLMTELVTIEDGDEEKEDDNADYDDDWH